nr:hypothetical protein [Polyangiaceae bacterium]
MESLKHVWTQPKRTLGLVLSCFALAACGHQRDDAPAADVLEADAPEADAAEADAPEADVSRALPPEGREAVDPLATDARLSMLASMMRSAGLTGELRGASGR